jgi:hypothetical protein
VALIRQRLGIEAVATPGKTGQFEVIADGRQVANRGGNWFTRMFGAGYPEPDGIVAELEKRRTERSI